MPHIDESAKASREGPGAASSVARTDALVLDRPNRRRPPAELPRSILHKDLIQLLENVIRREDAGRFALAAQVRAVNGIGEVEHRGLACETNAARRLTERDAIARSPARLEVRIRAECPGVLHPTRAPDADRSLRIVAEQPLQRWHDAVDDLFVAHRLELL